MNSPPSLAQFGLGWQYCLASKSVLTLCLHYAACSRNLRIPWVTDHNLEASGQTVVTLRIT